MFYLQESFIKFYFYFRTIVITDLTTKIELILCVTMIAKEQSKRKKQTEEIEKNRP